MWPNTQFPVDLVTFTEEILNENFIFLAVKIICSAFAKQNLVPNTAGSLWHLYGGLEMTFGFFFNFTL